MSACPNCGHHNSAQPARCGHCNYKLPETQTVLKVATATTRPCWNCTHANPTEAARCEACNAKQQPTVRLALHTITPETPAQAAGF